VFQKLPESARCVPKRRAAVMTKLNVQNMAELALKAADLSG
jgi:DNA-binding NarL/FixJ family response regulator